MNSLSKKLLAAIMLGALTIAAFLVFRQVIPVSSSTSLPASSLNTTDSFIRASDEIDQRFVKEWYDEVPAGSGNWVHRAATAEDAYPDEYYEEIPNQSGNWVLRTAE